MIKESIHRENPLITVIVPIYNTSEYLEKCIDSIINQTYKNLEIILVNDGSTDNSGAICDNYAKKDERIIIVHKENGGPSPSDARNRGLDICTGEYISFVDSDDFIDVNMLSILFKELTNNDADLAIVGFNRLKKFEYIPVNYEGYSVKILSREQASIEHLDRECWGKLYKRRLWKNIRFPYQKHSEDTFVNYKAFHLAKKILIIDLKLYNYFYRAGSITKSVSLKKIMDMCEAVQERTDFVCKTYPGAVSKACKDYFYIRCVALDELYGVKKNIPDSKYYIKKLTSETLNSEYIKYLKRNNLTYIRITLLHISPLALHLLFKCERIVRKLINTSG